MTGRMKFKGVIKIINSGGKVSFKADIDENVSLDALAAFKDVPAWFELDQVTPENDTIEVLMDGTTGEILG